MFVDGIQITKVISLQPIGLRNMARAFRNVLIILYVLFIFPASVVVRRNLEIYDYSSTRNWEIRDNSWYMPPSNALLFGRDPNGVRITHYGGSIGDQYNPVNISQLAISSSADLSYPINRKTFGAQVNWLQDNATCDKKHGCVWIYSFDFPDEWQKAPWISAMAQGHVLTVMSRAYLASGDRAYLVLAEQALRVFSIDDCSGGVLHTIRPGVVVYNEYPCGKEIVLDGWQYSLAGLAEYQMVSGSPEAKRLLDQGIASLSSVIDEYTVPEGILFSSRGYLSDPNYTEVNLNLLSYLAPLDETGKLSEILAQWEYSVYNNGLPALWRRSRYRP